MSSDRYKETNRQFFSKLEKLSGIYKLPLSHKVLRYVFTNHWYLKQILLFHICVNRHDLDAIQLVFFVFFLNLLYLLLWTPEANNEPLHMNYWYLQWENDHCWIYETKQHLKDAKDKILDLHEPGTVGTIIQKWLIYKMTINHHLSGAPCKTLPHGWLARMSYFTAWQQGFLHQGLRHVLLEDWILISLSDMKISLELLCNNNLSLPVQMKLPHELQHVHFFTREQTYKFSSDSSNHFPLD